MTPFCNYNADVNGYSGYKVTVNAGKVHVRVGTRYGFVEGEDYLDLESTIAINSGTWRHVAVSKDVSILVQCMSPFICTSVK